MGKEIPSPKMKYRLIESSDTEEGLLSIWHSSAKSDASWDDFLMKTPLGQFQQSSMWAHVKEVDGWECLRVVATRNDQIIGGFQILWRGTFLGRIGYVSKGPIAVPETPGMIERLAVMMRNEAEKHKILALIVQPPDESLMTLAILSRHNFVQSNPMKVIESTYLIDVKMDIGLREEKFSKTTRWKIRKAQKNGVLIREGDISDIPVFFNLMLATCKRQGAAPNPSSVDALRTLWKTFLQQGCVRLTLAVCNDNIIAANLYLLFGNRVTFLKKGWSGHQVNLFPNELLTYEGIQWSRQHKDYNQFDFAGINRGIAEALIAGRALSAEQKISRDIFQLHFGGVPKLLPPARIWIANSFVRFVYNHVVVRLRLL